MAKQTVLIDDIDGSTEGTETVNFSYAGKSYSIDLGQKNRDKLAKALEPFIEKAILTSTVKRQVKGKSNAAEVRVWAQEQGIEVPERGRIPGSVLEAFEASR